MTLQLPGIPVDDWNIQQKFDALSLEFPINATNLVSGLAGTTFPTSPQNGQDYYYVASAASGVIWHFKYRTASASIYKWEFAGGPPLFAEIVAAETTASVTYAALATAGPVVALPLAGDFMVGVGAGVSNNTAGQEAWMSYDIGGTSAQDADKVAFSAAAALQKAVAVSRIRTKTFTTALSLTAKYRVGGGTGQWQERWISVTPVRCA